MKISDVMIDTICHLICTI